MVATLSQRFKMEFEELKIEIPTEEDDEQEEDELKLPVRKSLVLCNIYYEDKWLDGAFLLDIFRLKFMRTKLVDL